MTEPLTLAQRLRSWDRCWPGNINIETAMDEAADELDRLRDANKALTAERDDARQSWSEAVKLYEQEVARVDPLMAELDAEKEYARKLGISRVDIALKLDAAEAERDEARSEIGEVMKRGFDRCDHLSAELAEARKVLEFYADPFDFVTRNNLDEATPDFYDELDTGSRARSFLASKEASHAE